MMTMLALTPLCDRTSSPQTSIDCDSEQYKLWSLYAIAMLAVYPVGIPGYFACLLMRHRHALNELAEQSNEKQAQRLHKHSSKSISNSWKQALAVARAQAIKERLPTNVLRIISGYDPRFYWSVRAFFNCNR